MNILNIEGTEVKKINEDLSKKEAKRMLPSQETRNGLQIALCFNNVLPCLYFSGIIYGATYFLSRSVSE